jgi:hypothetical protein
MQDKSGDSFRRDLRAGVALSQFVFEKQVIHFAPIIAPGTKIAIRLRT